MENIAELERRFNEQMQERERRILEALLENDSAEISVARLAKAIGNGCTKEQLAHAAWENHLPFGFGFKAPHAKQRGTAVLKDVFWRWWKVRGYQHEELF